MKTKSRYIQTGKIITACMSFLSMILLISCSNTTEPRDAQLTQLSVLRSSPGFEWFDPNYNAYTPDPVKVSQINALLNKDSLLFIMYVNPSCSCSGTQLDFPETMKILNAAGIKESQYSLYTMIGEGDNHPYMSMYHVNKLPSLCLKLGNNFKYSVMDSLYYYKLLNPNATYAIEDFILKALQ